MAGLAGGLAHDLVAPGYYWGEVRVRLKPSALR
jgi:hypothetical protein